MWRRWLVKITNAIQESVLDTVGRHREQKNKKLKSETKKSVEEKRRREMIEREIPRTNTEYAEYSRPIGKLVRDDIRDCNTIRVREAVETGNVFKKAAKKEYKVMIPSLKEEDGSITTNREAIFREMCRVLSEVV